MCEGDRMPSVRIIGPGRAGGALARALDGVGWQVLASLGRGDDVRRAAADADLVVIATPDASIAAVAGSIDPVAEVAVAHLSGALGLDVLAPHERRAAVHPLLSLPNAELGAERLVAGGWFAVAGDPIAQDLVAALGGRSFEVADEDRAIYHAAACVASNHVVALLGQVERLARQVGVPVEAFLDLTDGSVANVRALGARDALTGPAARGDLATIERHRAALAPPELELYDALVHAARELAAARPPVRADGDADRDAG
jgi:predicted short-subunit dehydrogenase-like oxidoreductase (DUF2520 family)